eukprot:TRINITY_DN8942_c0_g1_i1.p1 TRINITY_DN8942_c0_g1~~TRINITY_DN8942_c0_g1_i1.p1  ORF type:complete len:541 (+),score=118.19 TRINITY_DN8942_c0_g1_i1:17-1639(+)
MVLAELGDQINQALASVNKSTVVDDELVNQVIEDISRALLVADVNVGLVKVIKDRMKEKLKLDELAAGFNKQKFIKNVVFQELKSLLDPGVSPFKPVRGKPNVIMFVGLQGSGKTTTCTKYALWYQNKGWKVGLICADTFRAGAYDQLRQNAAKAKVPFYGSLTETDPALIAKEGVDKMKEEQCEIIIVDTSGRHKQESALFDEMDQIRTSVDPDDIIFIMDSSVGQAVHDQAKAFKDMVDIGSVIITKLDGHAKGGGALSAVAATKAPIVFVGTGEGFDDFSAFEPNGFLQQLLGMGNIAGFLDKIKDAGINRNDELYQRFTEGEFTFRDLYGHLQNIMKMGPVGKLMDMLPGMRQANVDGEHSTQKMKLFMVIMDSMTDKELDHPCVKKIMTPERQRRIGIGSGRSPMEIRELMLAYVKFEGMVKNLQKMDLKKLEDPTALTGKQGSMRMQQLARALDPTVIQQLGGVGGLQNMMQQFANTDQGALAAALGGAGGGGLAQMASQLGGGGAASLLASAEKPSTTTTSTAKKKNKKKKKK